MNKSEISLEQFQTFVNLLQMVQGDTETKILKATPERNVNIDGKKYAYYIEYEISQKFMDYYENKVLTYQFTKIIVSENNKWKIYDKEDYRTKLARYYTALALMYADGKGEDKDLHQGLINFIKAIDSDPQYPNPYFGAARCEYLLGNYQEALSYVLQDASIEKDNMALSDLYNLKGAICIALNDTNGAKESYEKSLELNPNNVYAKENLKTLQ